MWATAAAVLCIVAVAGCTRAEPKASDASQSVTVTSSAAAATPTTSHPTASPSVTPTTEASFNGTCGDLLAVDAIEQALNRAVVGTTAFIVGVPEPGIGRVAYLNCRYGMQTTVVNKKKSTTVALEVGISLYQTSAQATSRVQGTVEAYRANGARQQSVPVGPYNGTLLVGSGLPTLVVGAGPRTVAVTMSSQLAAAVGPRGFGSVANAALNSTAHFTQGGPAATSSSAAPAAS
jgi:hypothetical protein